MLKELYYIDNGVDIFHYGAQEKDSDHFVLSSGFLSALTSFAAEVRSAKIDFFSSQTEIFMFDELGDDEKLLVLIFENSIQQSVAREVLKHIKELLQQSDLIDLPTAIGLSENEEKKLRSQIHDLANKLISVEYQVAAAEEIINEIGHLDYLFIYDYSKDIKHLEHGNIKDLDLKEFYVSLRQISRAVIPMVKECDIGMNFDLMILESINFHLILSKYRTIFTLVVIEGPHDQAIINEIPFRLMSLPGFTHFLANYQQCRKRSSWKISDDTITLKEGDVRGYLKPSRVEQGIEAVNRLIQVFGITEFSNFTIYGDCPGYVKLSYYFTRGHQILDIYR